MELAISVTLLLLILAGIVDLGRAFFTLMAMQDAAEEGVVYGVAFPRECTNIVNRVRYNLSSAVQPENTTVAVYIKNSSDEPLSCTSISSTEVVAGREIADRSDPAVSNHHAHPGCNHRSNDPIKGYCKWGVIATPAVSCGRQE